MVQDVITFRVTRGQEKNCSAIYVRFARERVPHMPEGFHFLDIDITKYETKHIRKSVPLVVLALLN